MIWKNTMQCNSLEGCCQEQNSVTTGRQREYFPNTFMIFSSPFLLALIHFVISTNTFYDLEKYNAMQFLGRLLPGAELCHNWPTKRLIEQESRRILLCQEEEKAATQKPRFQNLLSLIHNRNFNFPMPTVFSKTRHQPKIYLNNVKHGF